MNLTVADTMRHSTYEATLYAPLFYASGEGRTIKTRKLLSATGLVHALGYRYFDLEKKYLLKGERITNPDYSYLTELPLFVSDMKPIEVQSNERTFRSTDYRSDRYFTTNDSNIANKVNGKKSVPDLLGKSGAAWQTIRNYTGIAPGAKYEFTLWANSDLPEKPSFRMGIKQTGEFRAERSETSEVTLNKYLLDKVYNVSQELLYELTEGCSRFVRGNDPRLQHFVGVPLELADEVADAVIE